MYLYCHPSRVLHAYKPCTKETKYSGFKAIQSYIVGPFFEKNEKQAHTQTKAKYKF